MNARRAGRAVLAAFALLAAPVVVAGITAGCSRKERPCPGGTAPDEPRTLALYSLLQSAPEAADLMRRVHGRAHRVCFGEVAVSAVTSEGDILLDRALGDAEAAARLGHLLHHVVEGTPAPPAGATDCDAAVARSLSLEGRAFSLELALRRSLGVRLPRLRYEFEAPYWSAPDDAREALIVDYLRAHPNGGPGIDALAAGYMRRCLEGRHGSGGAG